MLTFAFPKILWLLGLVPAALVYFLVKRRRRDKRVLALTPRNQEVVKAARSTRRVYRALFAAWLLAIGLIVLVVARPTVVHTWTKKWSEGIDIVLVMDISESMEADDLQPNRFNAAKHVIREFIKGRTEDRIAFVTFGGEAVTRSPLTRDYDFLLGQVDAIRMRELKQGTAIGMGLANGITRLRRSEAKTKVIVLMTDGDSNVGSINPITAANLARQENIKVYTIGIGASNRVVVPIYAYDLNGQKTHLVGQVPSYLNPELLATISKLTGGKTYMARDSGMLQRILQEIDSLEKTKVKVIPMHKREEKFLIPAAIALLLLLIAILLQETRYRRIQPNHATAL